MKRIPALLAILLLTLAACANDSAEEAAPAEPAATFISPTDGETVSSPFTVELAAEGVQLAPVGAPVDGEGHLHVMANIGCYETGAIIPGPSPEDEAEGRFHLGDGSDSREITLEPGTYELCVQLGDGVHRAFGSTQTITVTVE